jgi:FMN phosphatase YigB (HAD superfamily)
MVGDRPSDVVAGRRAGCRTIWLHTGRHLDARIETARPFRFERPDRTCDDLLGAARWLTTEGAA